jgi:hypothetical protein
MSMIALAALALVVVGAMAGAGWYFSEHQQRLRELEGVDVTRVADAKEGDVVRVVGVLRSAGHLLEAPLSHRSCAYYDVRVSELVSHGKSSRWVERFREVEARPFLVEDESGRAWIDTKTFVCAIVRDANQSSGTFRDASEDMVRLLERHGMDATGFLGLNRAIKYDEGVLEPGERVTVLGRARWEDDPDGEAAHEHGGGYRVSARRRRLVIEPGVRPVRASDDPAVTRTRATTNPSSDAP